MTSPNVFEAREPESISPRLRLVLAVIASLVILVTLAIVELGALTLLAAWSSALARHGVA